MILTGKLTFGRCQRLIPGDNNNYLLIKERTRLIRCSPDLFIVEYKDMSLLEIDSNGNYQYGNFRSCDLTTAIMKRLNEWGPASLYRENISVYLEINGIKVEYFDRGLCVNSQQYITYKGSYRLPDGVIQSVVPFPKMRMYLNVGNEFYVPSSLEKRA